MKELIKPSALRQGDTIATISLSWGGANIFSQRYQIAKKQISETFGIKVIETPHSLATAEELYNNPQHRLDDLMWAFKNPEIKGILTNIGGDDTIRLLEYMNSSHFEIIKNNPKIFLGMSDTTTNHFMCMKAGLSSFYSASTLFGYGENGGMPKAIINNTIKTLFNKNPIGKLPESDEFIVDMVPWGNEHITRKRTKSTPWRYIQGKETAKGRLIGGCIDVLDMINGTTLWPHIDDWDETILFLETSEEKPSPSQVIYWLRNFGAQGILKKIKGILFARPGGEFAENETKEKNNWLSLYSEYDKVLLKVCKEYNATNIPIVTNVDFGHTVPQLILPYGAITEINPVTKTVSILESAVS